MRESFHSACSTSRSAKDDLHPRGPSLGRAPGCQSFWKQPGTTSAGRPNRQEWERVTPNRWSFCIQQALADWAVPLFVDNPEFQNPLLEYRSVKKLTVCRLRIADRSCRMTVRGFAVLGMLARIFFVNDNKQPIGLQSENNDD